MDIFAFPPEIRLRIYSELLVHRGPINFLARFWGDLSSRLCPEGIDLCPTLLYVNKQVYREAISLLYSDNCFRFSDLDAASTQYYTTIAAFVQQIGVQAGRLRHVCIPFPPTPLEEDYSGLQKERFADLDLLRDACPGITTLELSLPSDRADIVLRDSSVFTELLGLIHTRLEAFQSLREVRVDVKLLGWDLDEKSDDGAEDPENDEQEGPRDDPWKTHRDSLEQLFSRGWAVNISKVPPVMEDNEDDYDAYIEWNRLEREEDEEWEEYYRERQLEGYRRGYADDGGPA
jgi:hypothetical protein